MNIFKYITSRKYRLFYKKIGDVQSSIWEFDFKVHKIKLNREKTRQDRERCLEAIISINKAIELEKDAKKKEGLEKEKEVFVNNVKYYEEQMNGMDIELSGIPASESAPKQSGMMDLIQGLSELREMYRDYLKRL